MENNGNPNQSAEPKKNKFKRFIFFFSLILIALWFIYYFICGITYSEGSRSGILTKISKKGYVFKTYEGELNIGGLNQGDGTIMPQSIFRFSVSDKLVYNQIEEYEGKKVVLHYKQVIKNFFWQGETDYFIYQVSSVK